MDAGKLALLADAESPFRLFCLQMIYLVGDAGVKEAVRPWLERCGGGLVRAHIFRLVKETRFFSTGRYVLLEKPFVDVAANPVYRDSGCGHVCGFALNPESSIARMLSVKNWPAVKAPFYRGCVRSITPFVFSRFFRDVFKDVWTSLYVSGARHLSLMKGWDRFSGGFSQCLEVFVSQSVTGLSVEMAPVFSLLTSMQYSLPGILDSHGIDFRGAAQIFEEEFLRLDESFRVRQIAIPLDYFGSHLERSSNGAGLCFQMHKGGLAWRPGILIHGPASHHWMYSSLSQKARASLKNRKTPLLLEESLQDSNWIPAVSTIESALEMLSYKPGAAVLSGLRVLASC